MTGKSSVRGRLLKCGRIKMALTTGVTTAFLYGAALMVLGFLAMFLVKEVPLDGHAPHLTSPSEIGAEILAEEAVLPADDEPVIVDVPGVDSHGELAREIERE